MGSEDEHPITISNKHSLDEGNLAPTESKRRELRFETRDGGPNRTDFTVEDYTIGWVCALHIEMAAAKCMLDSIHDNLKKSPNDSNTYILGSLHHHNVAIACLPVDEHITNSVAHVVSRMRRTFPSIQLFLMVGIGGGAPGKLDVRLGDVAVGLSLFPYNSGKAIYQGRFVRTDITRQPQSAFGTAISALRAHHESEISKIPIILSQMRERYPAMTEYTNREPLQDFLFDSAYDHAEPNTSCDDCDKSRLVSRFIRSNNHPMVHYGTIAYGSRVIEHGKERDQLAKDFNAICFFGMEAAGLMDDLQCLVIRGICDYSDSHKSVEWQKHASATAAAYAKVLLSVTPSLKTPEAPNIEFVQANRNNLMDSLWFEKIDARQSNITPPYGKTCSWLLSDPTYIRWLTPAEFPQHHGLLWIRGMPGAGKSTLMKYIYTRASETIDITISFFFDIHGDDLEKSTEGMYRSLLFQLFEKLPELQMVLDSFFHFNQGDSSDGLWKIDVLRQLFSAAISILGRRRVICLVDALDECSESQVRDMVDHFEELGNSALEAKGKIYVCFSSRHYPVIRVKYGWTLVLEDQIGHYQNLEKYIRRELQVGGGKDAELVRTTLLEKVAGISLWVVPVVNILNKEFHSGGILAVKRRLQETPAEISEVLKHILGRSSKDVADLLLCIQWLLYAKRPLTTEEFYYAVVTGLKPEQKTLDEWDPQQISKDDMKRFISSSSKGLAVTLKFGTVQFYNNSIRDFLLRAGGIRDLWPGPEADYHSGSHNQLRNCCNAYLKTDISRYISFEQQLPRAASDEAKKLRHQISVKFPLLKYATHHVLYHANMAAIESPQHDFLKTFDLRAWLNLNNLFAESEWYHHTSSASLLYILAENNFAWLINSLFHYDSRVNIRGEQYDYPLFAALANGHKETVQLLLDRGADIESKDRFGQTPLSWAAEKGQKETVQLLLDRGADIESKDKVGRTPLSRAAERGQKQTMQLLLDRGADIESKDRFGQTPLSWAVKNGQKEIVQLLLDRGADIESKGMYNQRPLSWAVKNGQKQTMQLLLDRGADIESKAASR
ncbi:hypothetical protein F5Y19DRAFT_472961 [Xylariaceae sp. FL1651]|nr:hypothetical protein F5Y19DRAFT_472961 [Xylariaceae sp. FL1651]